MRYTDKIKKRVVLEVGEGESIIAFAVTRFQKAAYLRAANRNKLEDWIIDTLDTNAGGRTNVDSTDL